MDSREASKWAYHLFKIGLIDVEGLYQIIVKQKDKAEALKEKYPEEYLVWRTKRRLLGDK
jgi:hypothetical protein